jgi:hypothetical protein
MDECHEVAGPAIETGGEAPEMLELVEATLDAVAGLVDRRVMRDRDFARAGRWNDRGHTGVRDQLAQLVAVVGFVGDDGATVYPVEQRGGCSDVMGLAACEDEAQRAAKRVGEHMDFGGQSSSGTPQSLILAPPFPVAAC